MRQLYDASGVSRRACVFLHIGIGSLHVRGLVGIGRSVKFNFQKLWCKYRHLCASRRFPRRSSSGPLVPYCSISSCEFFYLLVDIITAATANVHLRKQRPRRRSPLPPLVLTPSIGDLPVAPYIIPCHSKAHTTSETVAKSS